MKVFNFGSINIDYTYLVSDFVREGETVPATNRFVSIGGKGLNQSVALASAGVEVKHVGAVGSSDYSKIYKYLLDQGIDATYVDEDIVKDTGNAIVQLRPDGANSIIVYGGANTNISDSHYTDAIDEICERDCVLLQNEINDVERLIPKLKAVGAKLVLNPSPFTSDIRDWDLHLLDYLILNESELEGLLTSYDSDGYIKSNVENYQNGHVNLREMTDAIVCRVRPFLEAHPNLKMIITLGSVGSIYCTLQECFVQPAIPVEPVDTTGAGDTFTGYFIGEIMSSGNIRKALLTASAASAIAIERTGAAEAIPKRAEVLKRLNEMDISNDD